MEGFQEYQSRPVTRRAYRVKADDRIHALNDHTYCIGIGGKDVVFKAYETIFPGDYIVYLDADDVYHCRQAVFHERNIVD